MTEVRFKSYGWVYSAAGQTMGRYSGNRLYDKIPGRERPVLLEESLSGLALANS